MHELAGQPAPRSLLVNVPRLMAAYYTQHPDIADPLQRVAFGTSGHRGSAFLCSFNEDHILAVSQAICDDRAAQGIDGPLYLGMDTHALSEAALVSAVEVFAANGVAVILQEGLRYTPTPVISHAILTHNRGRKRGLADGVVVTPSHNPPEDGGFKYNPPEGGPADTGITRRIEQRANALLAEGLAGVKRTPFARAMRSGAVQPHDYRDPYVKDLGQAVDIEAIAAAGLRIGADPMGGATVDYWERIAEHYGLDLTVVNREVDPTFAFMRVDHDGRIRMDCSSAQAMAGLIDLRDRFDIAFGNDTDGDRHGIVTPRGGLLNPNRYLAAAVWYLFSHRSGWPTSAAIGKTLVSTAMIDRVARTLERPLMETPVGFKWFVAGLLDGSCGFGGEESAGASFLRRDGTVWTTDKDGIVMNLLACEILAKTGEDPATLYGRLEERLGRAYARRIDTPVTAREQAILKALSPEQVVAGELAGDPIRAKLTRTPANNEPIGGLKVVTDKGWFAARPSGTEAIYKLYAESFVDEAHLDRILTEAGSMIGAVFASAEGK